MVSSIIPSRGRPELLWNAIKSLRDGAPVGAPDIVVIAGDHETYRMATKAGVDTLLMLDSDAIAKFNYGAQHAKHEWIMTFMDDDVALPGWFDECMNTPNQGFIGLNEGDAYSAVITGQWLMTKAFCKEVLGGVLLPPVYKSWWADWEVCWHARKAGRYTKTQQIVIKHNHYTLGLAQHDETYRLGEQYHLEDGRVYREREAQGFPITWTNK